MRFQFSPARGGIRKVKENHAYHRRDAETYVSTSHKETHRLTPTCPEAGGGLRKRAIYGWKLGNADDTGHSHSESTFSEIN